MERVRVVGKERERKKRGKKERKEKLVSICCRNYAAIPTLLIPA